MQYKVDVTTFIWYFRQIRFFFIRTYVSYTFCRLLVVFFYNDQFLFYLKFFFAYEYISFELYMTSLLDIGHVAHAARDVRGLGFELLHLLEHLPELTPVAQDAFLRCNQKNVEKIKQTIKQYH